MITEIDKGRQQAATYLQRYACSYSTKSALTGTCGDILGPDGLRKKPNSKPWRKDYRLLAPRFWRRWTSCLSAHKRHRQIFTNQDSADVTTICFESAATPSVVARLRSFCAGLTRASDKLKVKLARLHKIAKSSE